MSHTGRIDEMCAHEPDAGPVLGAIDHVETAHDYHFGTDDDPAGTPYAVAELHRALHERGCGHLRGIVR